VKWTTNLAASLRRRRGSGTIAPGSTDLPAPAPAARTSESGGQLGIPVIYGLLLCVLLVIAPHAVHLPVWVSAICAALLGWRVYITRLSLPLPPRWLMLLVILGSASGILITFHTLFGRDASVALLILLTALKQMELRSPRDATVVIYLSCFIIITNFFYSQSIPTALYMFATLLAIVMTWLSLQNGALQFRIRLRTAAVMLAQAVPLTLVLFVLFPRVQGPLWGMPQDAYTSSGLDNKMSPGSLSKVSLSDAVAFRVFFKGQPPHHARMYWRGPVLTNFDGQTWTPGLTLHFNTPSFSDTGDPVDYTVSLEPHNRTWLFALEMPMSISIPALLTYDFQVVRRAAVNERLRYTIHSQLSYRVNPVEEPHLLQRALLLPAGIDPRSRQLAAQWRAQARKPEDVVNAALGYFSRQGFGYTLEPPLYDGADSIDAFMFGARLGFCEHYSSAFVFLMRAAGIPARVVLGYQGGEYNALGDYYIVRQSDAHAWAEVWIKDRGWLRVDPTAAVAPARIQTGLAAAVPDPAVLPFMARTRSPWLLRLRDNLDALANQWNQWVLSYDPERQFALLTRLGMESVTWRRMALLVGIYTLLMLRRLYVRNPDEALRLYLKFCRKLEKAGISRAAHEGPQDFAARASRLRPQLAGAIADITRRYVALRYGALQQADALKTLRRAIGAFKL
jgi:transglutaminase-like putative cysteine protease